MVGPGRMQDSLSTSRLHFLLFTACLNEPTSHTKQQALPAQDSVSGGMRQGFWWCMRQGSDLSNSCPASQSHTDGDAISAPHNIPSAQNNSSSSNVACHRAWKRYLNLAYVVFPVSLLLINLMCGHHMVIRQQKSQHLKLAFRCHARSPTAATGILMWLPCSDWITLKRRIIHFV